MEPPPPPPPPPPYKKKHSNFPSSAPASPEPKRKSGTACAACRYQRRRCPPDCILVPHFPNNNPEEFARVHKLFGVHNVVRTLKAIRPEFRARAAMAIVFEAKVHAFDPVGGCYRLTLEMRRRIALAQAELQYVLRCIEFVRSLCHGGNQGAKM